MSWTIQIVSLRKDVLDLLLPWKDIQDIKVSQKDEQAWQNTDLYPLALLRSHLVVVRFPARLSDLYLTME